MPRYKLYYFNARGRAEVIRWIFEMNNQEYDDIRLSREEWLLHKSDAPLGQCPWIDVDGVKIAQSSSIARYIAKQYGMAGKDDVEQAKVDMLAAYVEDLAAPLLQYRNETEADRKEKMKESLEKEKLPQFLNNFQRTLKQNKGGKGYFIGDSCTWCDIYIAQALDWVHMLGFDPLLSKYSLLKDHKQRIESHPKIAEWIAKRPESQY